jgi:hypothetical protein
VAFFAIELMYCHALTSSFMFGYGVAPIPHNSRSNIRACSFALLHFVDICIWYHFKHPKDVTQNKNPTQKAVRSPHRAILGVT